MPEMIVDERIYETANITGTGEYTLAGAVTGMQPLSVIGANNYAPLFVTDDINWEAGLYTYVSGPGRAQRTHVVKSSNGGVAVNWNNANVKIQCGWPAFLTEHRQVSKSVAGSSNVTLTALEQRCRQLILTGVLTGNINVIVDTTKWRWTIYNNTSGAFTLTVKTASGTGVMIKQGKRAAVECDGTNVVPLADQNLILGAFLARGSNTILGPENHGDTINATATYTQTTAAAATLGDGWFIDIIVDSGATLTIDPNSTETVDGSATKAIVGPASGRLVCNGTLFRTIGFSSSPITTRGDLIRGGVGGAPERVPLGSNRQILRSNGSDAAWATLDTFLSATATGASVEFNSLPENIGEIWINFVTVSTNGSVIPIVQLGNASAWVSSGYSGGIVSMSSSGPTIYGVSNSNGFKLDAVHSPAVVLDGCIVLSRYGGDFWQCSVSLARTDSNVPACGGGALNVGAPLTRLRLLMDGTDQFDSGGISIRYR